MMMNSEELFSFLRKYDLMPHFNPDPEVEYVEYEEYKEGESVTEWTKRILGDDDDEEE